MVFAPFDPLHKDVRRGVGDGVPFDGAHPDTYGVDPGHNTAGWAA